MKAATTIKTVTCTEGTKLAIEIPAGSLDRPTAQCDQWFTDHCDPANWKLPTRPFVTTSKQNAEDFAYTLNWYCGGHEISEGQSIYGGTTLYTVTSKGYYHYVGA